MSADPELRERLERAASSVDIDAAGPLERMHVAVTRRGRVQRTRVGGRGGDRSRRRDPGLAAPSPRSGSHHAHRWTHREDRVSRRPRRSPGRVRPRRRERSRRGALAGEHIGPVGRLVPGPLAARFHRKAAGPAVRGRGLGGGRQPSGHHRGGRRHRRRGPRPDRRLLVAGRLEDRLLRTNRRRWRREADDHHRERRRGGAPMVLGGLWTSVSWSPDGGRLWSRFPARGHEVSSTSTRSAPTVRTPCSSPTTRRGGRAFVVARRSPDRVRRGRERPRPGCPRDERRRIGCPQPHRLGRSGSILSGPRTGSGSRSPATATRRRNSWRDRPETRSYASLPLRDALGRFGCEHAVPGRCGVSSLVEAVDQG